MSGSIYVPPVIGMSDLVVAAVDASAYARARAQLRCDGTNDQAQINEALEAGGHVRLTAGTFTGGSPVLVPSGCWLSGAGVATILTLANDVDDSIIENASHAEGNANITISDLCLEGNSANNNVEFSSGIHLQKVDGFQLRNVTAHDTYGYAIRLGVCENGNVKDCLLQNSGYGGGLVIATADTVLLSGLIIIDNTTGAGYGIYADSTTDLHLIGCRVLGNKDEALAFTTSAIRPQIIGGRYGDSSTGGGCHAGAGTVDMLAMGASFSGCALYGMKLECDIPEAVHPGTTKLIGCDFNDNGDEGLQLYNDDVIVKGCGFQGNGERGIRTYYRTPTRLQIVNNFFRNNSQSGSFPHLEMDNTTNSRIIGNTFLDDQSTKTVTYAIKENATCSGNVIERNYLGDMKTAKLSVQAATVVRKNINYVTSNSGTATVDNGATYVDVTHGLEITPSAARIHLTATNNLGDASHYWVSDIGATTFRINVDADPGATTATFAWEITD